MTQTKVCTVCNEELDISEFGINARNKDGHRPECKICRKSQYDYTHKSPAKIKEQAEVKARQDLILRTVEEAGTLRMDEMLSQLSPYGINSGMIGHCIRVGKLIGHPTEKRTKNCNVVLTYTVSGVEKPEPRKEEEKPKLWEVWPLSVPESGCKPRNITFDDHWHDQGGMVAPGASLIQSSMVHLINLCGE
jgi:hypothetical protein